MCQVQLPVFALDDLEVRRVPVGHPAWPGRGVYAKRRLAADTKLGVYGGVLRPGRLAPGNGYVFNVTASRENDLVLDASLFGNILRFVNDPRNSSFEPNVAADDFVFQSKGCKVPAVLFRSTRDIEIGEELLYPYEGPNPGTYWGSSTVEVIDLTHEGDGSYQIFKREQRPPAPPTRSWKRDLFVVANEFQSRSRDFLQNVASLIPTPSEVDLSGTASQVLDRIMHCYFDERPPWRLIESPNGIVSGESSREFGKKPGAENGWNCESRGSVGFDRGIVEWEAILVEGGSGVRLGIARENIDLENGSMNTMKICSIHCSNGVVSFGASKMRAFPGNENAFAPGNKIIVETQSR